MKNTYNQAGVTKQALKMKKSEVKKQSEGRKSDLHWFPYIEVSYESS